jgi:ribosomal-protein-alanine N-acetyltransferase
MIILKTDRLHLRQFRESDAAAMRQVFADAEVMHHGPGVQSDRWIKDWLLECAQNYENRGFGPMAVVMINADEPIGYCGFFHFPDINGRSEIEIGYRLARAFWGHGYATEAVLAACDYGLDVLGLSRLIAMIDPANTESIKVAEKVGFKYEADVMLEGYTHPDRVYVITRSEED